jgi:hypothetical protein
MEATKMENIIDGDRRISDAISLRDYVDIRINETTAAAHAALEAWRSAYSRDERDMDRRLTGMNEFRAALTDQALGFMTRTEFNTRHSDLVIQMTNSFDSRDTRTQLALTATQSTLDARFVEVERRFADIRREFDDYDKLIGSNMPRLEFENRHKDLTDKIATSFDERDRRTQLALTTTQEALVKAEIANEKRFERLGDVQGTQSNLDARVQSIEQRIAAMSGRSGGFNSGWGYLVGGLGILVAIGTLLATVTK